MVNSLLITHKLRLCPWLQTNPNIKQLKIHKTQISLYHEWQKLLQKIILRINTPKQIMSQDEEFLFEDNVKMERNCESASVGPLYHPHFGTKNLAEGKSS